MALGSAPPAPARARRAASRMRTKDPDTRSGRNPATSADTESDADTPRTSTPWQRPAGLSPSIRPSESVTETVYPVAAADGDHAMTTPPLRRRICRRPGREGTFISTAAPQQMTAEVVDVRSRQLRDGKVSEMWNEMSLDEAFGLGLRCRRPTGAVASLPDKIAPRGLALDAK